MAYRGLNPHLCDVHIGLDGGQDILKVALTITERQGGHTSGRAYYSQVLEIFKYILLHLLRGKNMIALKLFFQGVAPRQAKHSSVKKLFLVGAMPQTAENYSNVKAILSELDIEALDFTVSADVKMCMYQ